MRDPHTSGVRRSHIRIGLTSVAAVFAVLLTVGCVAGCGRQNSASVKTMHAEMITELREVAMTSGIAFTNLMWTVDSCVDDAQGNLYRSTVTGDYPGGGSAAASTQLIAGWQAKLTKRGWSANSDAKTHSGAILAMGQRQLQFDPVDPAVVDPGPPFTYRSGCRPLDGDPDKAPGDLEDVTSDVMS